LGLWGGIYGLTGVVSAIGLSQGLKKDQWKKFFLWY
jgi:hypothetical protein